MVKSILNTMKYVTTQPKEAWQRTKNLYLTDAQFLILRDMFIKQEYYWLRTQLKPHTTVLDLGANIGDSAVYFAQFPEVEKIVSYELIPGTYRIAEANIKYAPIPMQKKITLFNKGIAEKNGTVRVNPKIYSDASARIGKGEIESSRGIDVELVTIEDAINQCGSKNIAIKCDIEGVEGKGFDNSKLDGVYAIQIEPHLDFDPDITKHLLELFPKKGFKAEEIRSLIQVWK